MFNVVHFLGDNAVAVVPVIWMIEDTQTNQVQCSWPNERVSSKINLMAKRREQPKPDWKTYDVRNLNTFATFDEARKWLPKATSKSDFSEAETTLPRLRAREDSDMEEGSLSTAIPAAKKRKSKVSLPGPSHKLSLVKSGYKPASPSSGSSSSLDSMPSFDELLSRHVAPVNTSDSLEDAEDHQSTAAQVTPQQATLPKFSPSTQLYVTPRRKFVGLEEFNAFKEMCASNFATIKASQQNISGMLVTVMDSLERMDKPQRKEPQTKDYGVSFPIRTMEGLLEVQSLLETDDTFYRHLEFILGAICGQGIIKVTNGILRYLMTDDLASNVNYTGRGSKTKLKFSETALDRIICEVVSKDQKLNAKRKDVADCIGKWLLHAADRIKYKKKSLQRSSH